jgi:uncharacterized protein (DUF305 family)
LIILVQNSSETSEERAVKQAPANIPQSQASQTETVKQTPKAASSESQESAQTDNAQQGVKSPENKESQVPKAEKTPVPDMTKYVKQPSAQDYPTPGEEARVVLKNDAAETEHPFVDVNK